MVLDASVALAWFVDNSVPEYAINVRKALIDGTKAVVPALWHLEMANGLVVAERRRLLSAMDLTASLVQIEKLSSSIETDSTLFSTRQASDVARSLQLSAYDSAYLETARSRALPLATLDKKLRAAASRAGVKIFQ
jgi:predicted nucleic acid-binding protein